MAANVQAAPQQGWVADPQPAQFPQIAIDLLRAGSPRTPPNYQPLYRLLGKGGFGVVYCVRLAPMVTIARKVSGIVEALDTEVQALQELRDCPYIIRALDYEVRGTFARLDMEVCSGDLSRLLTTRSNGQFTNSFTAEDGDRILFEVASALNYMHEQGYVHNDVKPDNVLIDSSLRAKVADLGLVEKLGNLIDENSGTYIYNPPECDIETEARERKDTWGYGLIALQFLTRSELPRRKVDNIPQAAQYAKMFLNQKWNNDVLFPKRGMMTPTIEFILEHYLVIADTRPDMKPVLEGPFRPRHHRAMAPYRELRGREAQVAHMQEREWDLQERVDDMEREKGVAERGRAAAEAESARNLAAAEAIRVESVERVRLLEQQLNVQTAEAARLRLDADLCRAREMDAIAALENERQRAEPDEEERPLVIDERPDVPVAERPDVHLARPREEVIAALENAAHALNAVVTGAELIELAKHAHRVSLREEQANPAQFSLPLRNILECAANATHANNGGCMRALLLIAMSAIRTIAGQPVYSAILLRSLMHASIDQIKRSRDILRNLNLHEF